MTECRPLYNDYFVEPFVEGVLDIHDDEEKAEAIKKIVAAERSICDSIEGSTWNSDLNRDFRWRKNSKREELRKRIVTELFEQERVDNDDEITLGYGGAKPSSAVRNEKKAILVIGPPASGKSTISNILAEHYGAYIIDSDYAKRKLPEYNNSIGGASYVHDESSHLTQDTSIDSLLTRCIKCGANIVLPKIGDNENSLCSFAKKLSGINYRVYLVSIDLDRRKATRRAYDRFVITGRYVPLGVIFDKFSNQPTLNYFRIKQRCYEIFDGYAQVSTDVSIGESAITIEIDGMDELSSIVWRRDYAKN